jgi:hypothetical protein
MMVFDGVVGHKVGIRLIEIALYQGLARGCNVAGDMGQLREDIVCCLKGTVVHM